MKRFFRKFLGVLCDFFRNKFVRRVIIGVLVILIFLFAISPLLILEHGKNNIYPESSDIPHCEVAIVFGAGIKDDGTPSDALKDRLITAAELYNAGTVDKILVSGDNRFENYNEPEAMYDYLVDTEGVASNDIAIDYAGRRTYDTCVRANELWGVEEAILISQGYHLPRAIFTCEALGIDSVGYSATRQGYVFSDYYKVREVLAIYKAVIDVYIWEPTYVGGEPETL